MPLEKPVHVDKKVWKQHLDWMKVMNEGQLTDENVNKGKKGSDKDESVHRGKTSPR